MCSHPADRGRWRGKEVSVEIQQTVTYLLVSIEETNLFRTYHVLVELSALYQKNADHPAVEDAHCAYLRYREMTALVASIMTAFVVASVCIHPSLRGLTFGFGLIAAEYFLLLLAARNAADHFVSNVLAIESAGTDVRSLLV